MTPGDTPKSVGDVMGDIMGNVSNLVRNEVDLARAELATSFNTAKAALGTIAVAAMFAITGLVMLATGLVQLVIWLGAPANWASTIVGSGFVVLAIVVFQYAKSSLRQVGFIPTRAARNIKRDAIAIKEAYNDK